VLLADVLDHDDTVTAEAYYGTRERFGVGPLAAKDLRCCSKALTLCTTILGPALPNEALT
jgi:hypothetical protein